MMMID